MREIPIGLSGSGPWVVDRDRETVTRCFGQAHRARDSGVRDEIREVPPHLVDYLKREPVTSILHRQHDRQYLDSVVQASSDRVNCREQLSQALEGVVLALHRNDDPVSCRESVDRQQSERRWAVDKDRVVVANRTKGMSEPILAGHQRHELDLSPRHVGAGWDDVEARDGRWDNRVVDGSLLQDESVDWIRRRLANAQPAGRVRLGIKIDNQYPLALLDEGRAEAYCGRCLANSALLIGDDEDGQMSSPVTRETTAKNRGKTGSRTGWFVPSILADVSLADHLSTELGDTKESRLSQPF